MHWENLGELGPFAPVLAILLLLPLGAWLFSARRRRRLVTEGRASMERYWAAELAHQAKMRATSWLRGSRSRRLTWRPTPSDEDIAGHLAQAYGEANMTQHSFANRLARAKFRAWHRGTREADFTIGGYFDRHHSSWSEDELGWFEDLLEEEDSDILAWAMATHVPPEKFRGPMMSDLQKLDYVSI